LSGTVAGDRARPGRTGPWLGRRCAAPGIPTARHGRWAIAPSFGRFGETGARQLIIRLNIPSIDLAALQRWNVPAVNRSGIPDAAALAAAGRLDIGSQRLPPRPVSLGGAAARAAPYDEKTRTRNSRAKRPKRRLKVVETGVRNSGHGADKFGFKNLAGVHWNLP